MTRSSQIGGLILGAVLCLAIAAGSRIPWTPVPDGSGLIRLSWRTVLPSIEECREPTEDEVAHLPAHMRPAEVCTGEPIPFRLRFSLDGRVVVDEVVVGAGRGVDRPVHVYHEVPVRPGTHRVDVDFEPEDPTAAGVPDGLGSSLGQDVLLDPLGIALITLQADGGLVLR